MRDFDPAVDDENTQPSRRPRRVQDPYDPSRMIPYPNFQSQPTLQFPMPLNAPLNATLQSFQQFLDFTAASARAANTQDLRADPSYGPPLQDVMRRQQLALDTSSSDQAMPAATPTTPNPGIQVPYQEQSLSATQARSPIAVQGQGLTQQVDPDSFVYSNLPLRPGQLNPANFQPQFATHAPYQPVMNGDHGQQSPNISRFVQSPDPDTRHEADPANPMTLARELHFQPLGYQYPEPHDPFPITSDAVPSAEWNALTDSQNCRCGSGCDCVFCRVHPYNAATRERVQDLTQIMARDNYWPLNHSTQPQSVPTNGTNIEPVMSQGYPPLAEEPLPSAASAAIGWINSPIQGPAPQPTFEEEASADEGDHSDELSPRTMRNSAYWTLEYTVSSNCTDATGTCRCGSDCGCLGCLTHQGHNGPPN